MKYLLTIILICLSDIVIAQNDQDVSINADLSFGVRTDCFRRGGICTFQQNVEKNQANTSVLFNNKDQTLILRIDRNQITPNEEFFILGVKRTAKTNIAKQTFLIEDELVLDDLIKNSLNIPDSLSKIASGSYPVIVKENMFEITLKLF